MFLAAFSKVCHNMDLEDKDLMVKENMTLDVQMQEITEQRVCYTTRETSHVICLAGCRMSRFLALLEKRQCLA
jgi:hypothetical protein